MPDPDADPFATVVPIARSPFHPGSQAGAEQSHQAPAVIPTAVPRSLLPPERVDRDLGLVNDDAVKTGSQVIVDAVKGVDAEVMPAELIRRMLSTVARQHFEIATDAKIPELRRKYATTSLAICVEKLHDVGDKDYAGQHGVQVDEFRAGVLDLARRALGMP